MASIRKREWRAPVTGERKTAYELSYKDNAGKRRRAQFARRKDAEDAWQRIAAELGQGIHTPKSEAPTVERACEQWLKHCTAAGLEAETVKRYRNVADKWLTPRLGARRLSSLTVPGLQAWLDELLAEEIPPATVATIRRHLVMLLNFANRRGQIAHNPAQATKLARRDRHRGRVEIPTLAQIKALLAWTAAEHADAGDARRARMARPMVELAIAAGLRNSELRGLRWSDLDFKRDLVSIDQRADRNGRLGPPKSAAGRREIRVPRAVMLTAKRWKVAAPASPAGLVFPTASGGAWGMNNLRRDLWQPLMAAAELADADDRPLFGLHALRHYCASVWIDQHATAKQLQAWLGHSSIALTYNTYGHLLERRDRGREDAFIAGVEAALFGDG